MKLHEQMDLWKKFDQSYKGRIFYSKNDRCCMLSKSCFNEIKWLEFFEDNETYSLSTRDRNEQELAQLFGPDYLTAPNFDLWEPYLWDNSIEGFTYGMSMIHSLSLVLKGNRHVKIYVKLKDLSIRVATFENGDIYFQDRTGFTSHQEDAMNLLFEIEPEVQDYAIINEM